MPDRRLAILAAIAIAAGTMSLLAWRIWFPSEDAVVRNRLNHLRDEVNAGAADGLGLVARAAAIGGFFADDVVVDLGQGTAPIDGRETVMAMATRLQPRTAAFRLDLADVGVTLDQSGTAADVMLTASFTRRSVSNGEETMDAREFALKMLKTDGVWRIKQITAVKPLK